MEYGGNIYIVWTQHLLTLIGKNIQLRVQIRYQQSEYAQILRGFLILILTDLLTLILTDLLTQTLEITLHTMETQTLTLKITLHTMETQTPTLEITLLTMETRTRTRATTLHSMEQCWNCLGGARRCLLGLTKNGITPTTL